ncbi:MAG: NPCBM/NEW2 domain-containing protein [Planctomycetes bacterium]|nr:NPCBM/NEW2 domain-containing protein [Planctomycetota bacterium]
MQADRIQVLVQQAAAGNVDAFVALVQEFAPTLRLALGAHLDQSPALGLVEISVWSAVRARLGEWLPETPFADWILQVAVDPLTAHLTQADRRAIDIQDALSHQVIEQCREALADGSELQVFQLPSQLAALPEATRSLLIRRYSQRQRPDALAASLMISEAELATTLAAARAACDWRGIAHPPGPGDRLLPPLIEDWLNGTIDVDSRALLATNLGRDPERAQQFSRQVRVHLALSAVLAPFSREDAVVITRQTGLGAGDSGRVMMGEGPRPVSGLRPPASDARRVARMTTSNRHVMPLIDDAPRPSPMPWIIGGGMVLVGIIALVAMSLRTGTSRAAPPRPLEPAAVRTVAEPVMPTTTPERGAPAAGGVLRLDPGRTTGAPPPPPRVALSPTGRTYGGQPLVLRADLSHSLGVTAVEFWKGDERVATVAAEPFAWTWDQPPVGTTTFTVRALGSAGTLATSAPTPVTITQVYGSGTIRREWWTGVSGYRIAEGVSVVGYPDRPQGEADEPVFSARRDWGDDYLQRLRGFIVPPLDGAYVFWIASDDEGELWLSDNDTRSGLRRIAVSPVNRNEGIRFEEWERHPDQQRSGAITLQKGRRYYVEVLHKEGGNQDHVSVGWQLPDGTLERPIPGAHLSPPTDPVPPSAPAPPLVARAALVRSIDFVASGAAYVLGPARNGEKVYIDREYKLVDLPPFFEQGQLIRTRNDDDGAVANPHLRFTADVAVDVYLAYATTATSLPSWMQGWTATDVVVGADKGGGFRLHRRTFAAGPVVLGANERNTTNAQSNYFVMVLPAGGLLQGAVAPSALVVNLSDLGTSDWIHYGLKDAASFTRRSGGGQLAVARTADQALIERYDDNKVRFGWSNGTPDAAIAETQTGWFTDNGGKGFTFTAPADPVLRRLVVWVGGWKTHAILTATLSDNSAPLYRDDSITIDAIGDSLCYTLLYRAKEQGAKLTISYSSDNPNDGNITLQAVALSEYGDGSPRFVKASPGSPPPAAVPAPAISAARRPDLIIWDGDGANGGAGYKGFGAAGQSAFEEVADQGHRGAGLRARLAGGNAANVGWNWHAWSSDTAGTDLNGFAALTMWLRFSGPAAPQKVVMRLACSPRDPVRRTVDVNLTARQPGLLDGAWHQVIVPLAELVPQGQDFDRAKVWEVAFDISSTANMDGTFDVDEIGAVRSLTAPPPAAVVPWKVVRAINLGGEATEFDGVKFIGHRQAEADGATPANSHQPGPWLSDLNWIRGTTGNGEIRKDRSMDNRPLTLDGKVYAKGLGVHAVSELVYALDGRQSGFTAMVGIDDEAPNGEVIFQVWLDGQKAWDSGVVRKGMVKPVAVPLTGRKELRLVVDSNGPNDADHADWVNAQFLIPGGDDGALQVQIGQRKTATFTPKPAVDNKLRMLLGTAIVGTKESLAFRIKVPNGLSRVWLWLGENGSANSRQFDLVIEGVTLPGVGSLPAAGWEKVGPVEINVTDGAIDVAATVIKGTPQVMGILVEQPALAPAPVTPIP